MNYDKTTFGRAPAAMYLVTLLNERDDPVLARKVGKILRNTRELLNDVVSCHLLTDQMKTASFGKLINMIKERARSSVSILNDEHIAHLVVNILVGEIRTFERRCQRAAALQVNMARSTPEGNSVPMLKATPMRNEPSEDERIEMLQEKSRAYLARKGKRNTLY